jgi:hypothetical protein
LTSVSFPELMAELDAIKETIVLGLIFRRDHKHRRSHMPLPWITERKDLRYLRSVVKKIVAAAGFELSAHLPRSVTVASRKVATATSLMLSYAPRPVIDRHANYQRTPSVRANS